MNINEAVKMQEEASKKKIEIRKSKAKDYAQDEDCLSNFKVMADLAWVLEHRGYKIDINTPQGVAMWHLLHKFVRILNLFKKQTIPENESVVDTFIDLENYSELSNECYTDDSKQLRVI